MVAALFVETNGCYFGLPNVDPWDEQRDARQYAGPHPVVAHPPCQRWGSLANVNHKRWGTVVGSDNGCFESALYAVNTFGGVMEHPARSMAYKAYGLTRPVRGQWTPSDLGWTCEVAQSAYGHQCQKLTWLYYRGAELPPEVDWSRPPGTHTIGGTNKGAQKPNMAKKDRIKTPVAFRDILIQLAEGSR